MTEKEASRVDAGQPAANSPAGSTAPTAGGPQHSPLPWRSVEHEGLRDADGEWITRTDGDDSFSPMEADSRYIVTACNAYPLLVDALTSLVNEAAGVLGAGLADATNADCLRRRVEKARGVLVMVAEREKGGAK